MLSEGLEKRKTKIERIRKVGKKMVEANKSMVTGEVQEEKKEDLWGSAWKCEGFKWIELRLNTW